MVRYDKHLCPYRQTKFGCLCDPPKKKSVDQVKSLNVDDNQLQFSAGRYVGTAFKHSWQGAPKGKKILYRQNK